jgi:Spy/CpxP family protein refolding chaperone
MPLMKPLIYVLAAALMILQAGCAAGRYHPQHRELSVDQLAQELDLTGPQKTQVGQILDSERAEREQLRESAGQMSPDDRRQQMRAMQSELIQKMSAVLSPAQLQKFEQLEQQQHGHRGRRSESYGQGPPE